MAKSKSNPGIQNKAIYSRASYLYQAASYLAHRANEAASPALVNGSQQGQILGPGSHGGPAPEQGSDDRKYPEQASNGKANAQLGEKQRKQLRNLSRHAISEMRAVTLKAQIRQSHALKRTICKFCDTLQLEGRTCRSAVENPSRDRLKPWADVLVVRCETCGNAKRFPVCAARQKRKTLRPPKPRGGLEDGDAAGQKG